MWDDGDDRPATRRDWADLGRAVLRLAWQLVQLAGNVAFILLQVLFALLLGFGAVLSGALGAGRRRR